MKRLGVIGYPIKHSISPQMHSAAIAELGLDYTYESIEVKPEDLGKFIDRMKSGEIYGINVTIPHKENIIRYLDEVEDVGDIIGAVNTVVNKNGKLVGYNTDYKGFIESLTTKNEITASGKSVFLIGCGGAAKAISPALCLSNITKLFLYDLDSRKANNLKANLNENIPNAKIFISSDLVADINSSDLIINATPVGMYPNIDEMPIPNVVFNKDQVVYDVIYNPLETKLLKIAREAGAKTVNGLNLFVCQGALSFKIFTGENVPFVVMKNAVLSALKLS